MVKEYKTVNKPSSIGSTYEADLVNKLNAYSKLIGVDRTKIVSSLIAEKLEGRILTNDFIDLDRPYYFNYHKLIHEGTVEATTEEPVPNADLYFILKKVPNNLDRPNKKYGTYSYSEDKPSVHKGIYYYALYELDSPIEEIDVTEIADNGYIEALSFDNVNIIDFYFLFEYEQESNKIIIHSIEEDKLIYVIDPLVYPEIYKTIQKQEQEFIKNLRLPNGNVNLALIFDYSEVMISYKLYKDTELDLAYDNDKYSKVTYLKGYSEFNKFINK